MASCAYHVKGSVYQVGNDKSWIFESFQDAIEAAQIDELTVWQVRLDGTKYKFWDWKRENKRKSDTRKNR